MNGNTQEESEKTKDQTSHIAKVRINFTPSMVFTGQVLYQGAVTLNIKKWNGGR
jgi:hypothetical protein